MSLLCDPGSKVGLGGSKENLGENVRDAMEQPGRLKSCYARTDKSRYGKAEHIVMCVCLWCNIKVRLYFYSLRVGLFHWLCESIISLIG